MNVKSVGLLPVRFIDSVFDRIAAVLGAVTCAQIPQFIAQYIQRLGGHADEALSNIERYRETATSAGKSLDQYVQYLMRSTDIIIVKTGKKIAADIERYKELQRAIEELTSASIYDKFFVFIKHFDMDIARKTYDNFTAGIPVTFEGFIYAIAGIIIGMILYFSMKKIVLFIFRKAAGRRKKKQPAEVPYM